MVGKGNLAVFESSNISKTGEVTRTKIGVHVCYINTYVHEFFEPIFDPLNFWMTMDYSPCLKREIWPFLKGSNISETKETTPTKTGVHALDIDPTCMNF